MGYIGIMENKTEATVVHFGKVGSPCIPHNMVRGL